MRFRHKFWVVAFIAAQTLIPASLLAYRTAAEGWHPRTVYPFSWQMYSTIQCDPEDGSC